MIKDLSGIYYFKFILLLSLVLAILPANAQIQNIKFNHLTVDDGLSQNNGMCAYQDSKGFMWFGTYAGLNRYDGRSFKIYLSDQKDSTTLSDNWIMKVIEDTYGNLWVSSLNRGLNKYNYKTDSFTRYQHNKSDNSLPNDAVNAIFIDKEKNLWIGTSNGLARYNYDTDDFTSYFYNIKNKGGDAQSYEDHYYSIEEDNSNNLILATGDEDLFIFNKKTAEFKRLQYLPKKEKKQGLVEKVLLFDSTGILWIGSVNKGLYSIDYSTKKVKSYSEPGNKPYMNSLSVRSLLVDQDFNLWVGTDGQGLFILNHQRTSFKNYRSDAFDRTSLGSNNGIYDIFEDRNGIIWLAQYNAGINYYDRNEKNFSTMQYNPTNPKSLSSNYIFSFLEDSEGTIWVGTDGGGLNIFHPDTREFEHYKHDPSDKHSLQSNIIKCIAEDKNGNLLLGTWNAGIMVFNKKTGKSIQYRHDPDNPETICDDDVWDIEVDNLGRVWLGTLGGGVDCFYPKEGRFEHFGPLADRPNKVNNDDIRVIYKDPDGIIWFGTLLGGVDRLNPSTEQFTYITNNPADTNSLAKNDVRAIFRDREGYMWFGTEGNGLDRYDEKTKSFIQYTTKDGLPSDNIHGIQQDDNGVLWISTGKGLATLNPETKEIKVYNKFDGLQGNDFQYGADMKTKDGTMYFGGLNGFNVFHPANIKDNTHVPNVVFTRLFVLYKEMTLNTPESILKYPIEETKSLTLNYNQNVISFEFATLNYTNSDKNLYAYKMEGFDKDWHYAGSVNNATYTNLDPGEYTFHVKGANNDGVWNETGSSIQVIITPPFWVTWWFRTLIALLIIYLAYTWYRARIKKINRQKEELEKQVDERTKELNERNRDLVISKKQTDDILNNVKDGLFLLNKNFIIESQYSKSLETILSEEKLGGRSFLDYLEGKIKKSDIKNSREYFELLFDNSVDSQAISELNPLAQIEFSFEDKENDRNISKFLAFNFGRIIENNTTEHIITTVNDITDKIQLEKDLKQSQEESKKKMEVLLKILNIEPAMLHEFINNAQEEINNIDRVFNNTKREDWSKDTLTEVGRYIHTIKGNAGLLDLEYLAQKAHQAEDEITQLKNRKKITRKNTKNLFQLVKAVQDAFYELKDLIDQIGKLNAQLNQKGYDKDMMFKFLGKLVDRLAKEHDKRAKLIMDDYLGDTIPIESRSLITDILVQLIRNSIAHGIETTSIRKKAGKDELGKIEISNSTKGNTCIIQFKDDGQGIQLDKLRKKAMEMGKWSEEEVKKWDDEKLANIIFIPHLSTTEKAGMTSGRGMGMDIIKSKIEKLNGRIKIDTQKDKYCQFTIEFSRVA